MSNNDRIFRFDDYILDTSEQRLLINGEKVPLTPKVFEVLVTLLESQGKLLTHEEIIDSVWKDTYVEETNLRYCIHSLRKTLRKDLIETIPKRGYRLNSTVTCEVKTISKDDHLLNRGPLENEASENDSSEIDAWALEGERLKEQVRPNYFWTISVLALVSAIGFSSYFIFFRGPASGSTIKTVAVAPFNIIGKTSANAEDKKGLLDSLVFNLGKINRIQAVPIDEVGNLSESEALGIGAKLNAGSVLTGSIRYEEGKQIRVTAKLREIHGGEELISETFNIKFENTLETEKTVAVRIARKVDNLFAEISDKDFLETQNVSSEIKAKYLTGRQILRNFELNRRAEGLRLFTEIIEAEPNWVPGNARYLEVLYRLQGMDGWEPERFEKAIENALKLDRNLPEAYAAKAWLSVSRFEWKKAERFFRKSIELDPEYAYPYYGYGILLDAQRRFVEAEKTFEQAIRLEPFDPLVYSRFCEHYFYDRNFEKAEKQCKAALRLEGDFVFAKKRLFWIAAFQDEEKAVASLFKSLSPEKIKKDPLATAALRGETKTYWVLAAEKRLKRKDRVYSPRAVAGFYAMAGQREKTLDHFERIPETFSSDFVFAVPSPEFDFVRKEPRFIKLMKKYGLEP